MPAFIDLLILPLARFRGQDQPAIPGLFVASPPRKTARFRDKDHLALHLFLEGGDAIPASQLEELLASLAKTYYNTAGTITTAQRAVAERLNQYLLDRNLHTTSSRLQLVGHLTQIVVREGRLALAQSGLVHAHLISEKASTQFHDLQLSGNGLGLSKTTQIHHSLTPLKPQDYWVIAMQPPLAWSPEALQSFRGQGPESLRRKLLTQAGTDINAFLLYAQEGTGRFRLLRPVRAAHGQAPVQEPASPPRHTPSAQSVDDQEGHPLKEISQAERRPILAPGAPRTEEASSNVSVPRFSPVEANQQTASPHPGSSGVSRQSSVRVAGLAGVSRFARNGLHTFGTSTRNLLRTFAALARQILPDQSIFTLPAGTMAFIAIIVPIIVVSASAMVYFQRGRTAQFEAYFTQAQAAAATAASKTDPQELRQAWQEVLYFLDQAEEYRTTTASRDLRQQAYTVFDQLEGINRLQFSPAIAGGLPETTQVKRLVAVDDDLYILDASAGTVLRAVFTNQGYILDPTFQCGPGPYAGIIVGAILDIAPAPRGDPSNAAIVGIDTNHILTRCIPGQPPEPAQLSSPDIVWGPPRAITVDDPDLYVLDPQANAVWVYRRMEINNAPRLFFDVEFPTMDDVIDLAAYQNDLFLLHANGQITTCVYSSLQTAPTRCEEPAVFTDPRPGRQSGPTIEGAIYSEIKFSPPPEPSLYLLDPLVKGINLFSVRLSYALQYRPAETLSNQRASAFAINKTNRTVFLAIGNQVYYAALP